MGTIRVAIWIIEVINLLTKPPHDLPSRASTSASIPFMGEVGQYTFSGGVAMS